MKIEQLIREHGREENYKYYISLGYDDRTSAVLALFTYGSYRYNKLSINDLYDALLKGKEYLPQEVIEERKRQREFHKMMQKRAAASSRRGRKTNAMTRAKQMISLDRGPAMAEESVERLYCTSPNFAKIESTVVSKCNLTADVGSARTCSRQTGALDSSALARSMTFACGMPLADGMAVAGGAGFGGGVGLMQDRSMSFATDEYELIEEKAARGTASEPTSTFRMTTNTASAGVILNQLRNGRRIDRSMVRIEEMLNYFRYDSKLPEKEMFNIAYELMDVDNGKKYLYINVQGREEVKERQNIIILLDVSGSMHSNAEKTQAIVATIVSKLGNGDKVSLVTYSGVDNVELEAFTVNGQEDRISVLEKLLSIEINGCTWGSRGIETAYKIGKKNFIYGGNNQVILITDGDLNFGITDKGGLEELIERKKKDNLFLSVIGTGLWNYKDDKLETLSKHGNGVYRVVNNLTDVNKSINEEYSSLVNIIAKDVKAQVEFNPEIVESYRLLGFENRTLAREDFTNDKVISEPFGSGGYGVAVYELTMKTGTEPADSGLKYSKLVTTGSKELGTVKVRCKEPLEDASHELEKVIETAEAAYTDNLKLAFIVYVCAEKLRGSDKITTEEIGLAKKLYKELGEEIKEKNSADLYKLAGILEKSEHELGIGIEKEPFLW